MDARRQERGINARVRPSRLESLTAALPIINRCFNQPHPPSAAIHNGQSPERPRREPGARLPLPSTRMTTNRRSQDKRTERIERRASKARGGCARNESGKPPRPSHRGKRAAGSDDRRKRVRRINRAHRRRDKESASKLAARAIADGRHRRHNDAPQDCEARLAACLAETSDLALRRPCTLQAKPSLTKVSCCTDKFISIGHINIQGVAVTGRILEVLAAMQQRRIKMQILTEAQITGSTVFRTEGY